MQTYPVNFRDRTLEPVAYTRKEFEINGLRLANYEVRR
jgi:hypothetical protein